VADLSWNEAAFMDQFRHGLCDDVQDLLLGLPKPEHLDESIEQAIHVDNHLFECC
ncbi:hypothetical protein HDU82_003619, partial [Entophlyctis luteolus]